MTGFGDIRAPRAGQATLDLLYVGSSDALAAQVLAFAAADGPFRHVARATSLPGLVGLSPELRNTILSHTRWDSGLVVVVELPDGRAEGALEILGRHLAGAPWGPQVTLCGLAGADPQVTLRTFASFISNNFIGVGALPSILAGLSRWCAQTDVAGLSPNLRLPFGKLPSQWIRGIHHDYFANALPTVREHLEAGGLVAEQVSAAFWQNALRNTLVFRAKDSKALDCEFEDASAEVALLRDAPWTLIAPLGLEYLLDRGWEPENLQVYRSDEEACRHLEEAGTSGKLRVLLRDAALPPLNLAAFHRPGSYVPVIWVAESPARRTWEEWQFALASGVVGSFDWAELAREAPTSVVEPKAWYWRCFCLRTIPQAFDVVLDAIVRAQRCLETRLAGASRESALESMFRCAALVWAARGLYCREVAAPLTGPGRSA